MFAERNEGKRSALSGKDQSTTPLPQPQSTSISERLIARAEAKREETWEISPGGGMKATAHPSLVQAMVSPAVVSGVGNTLFVATLNNQYVTLFYAGIVGLSFLNELRANYGRQVSPEDRREGAAARAPGRGIIGFVREQLSLPGVCLVVDGMAFLGTGIGYLIAKGFSFDTGIKMVVFGAFAIASFAGARLSNQGVQRESREPWWLERHAHTLWSYLPRAMQTYLQNPGAIFATGNLPNYTTSLLVALSAVESVSLAQTVAIGLAAGCTLTAAALGVLPFLGKVAGWHKAAPCIANGAGNFLFGVLLIHASICSASVNPALVGCAAIAWAFGNLGIAIRIARDRG
jgi:hypothetical protein